MSKRDDFLMLVRAHADWKSQLPDKLRFLELAIRLPEEALPEDVVFGVRDYARFWVDGLWRFQKNGTPISVPWIAEYVENNPRWLTQ